ncbi:MAG: D-alanyl-D-alanine carboxypeptidase/D-alanyl-D-alanine-endopeptidase [Bacteroidaceae bacterium]|nr:D-alanyl-D-alanine carboxypeptidase/D-alanyl-D-alanine-endopeptidase [Bacteroidaceae bacterium]
MFRDTTTRILFAAIAASILTGCASQKSIEEKAYRDAMRDMALEQMARRDSAEAARFVVQPRQLTADERWPERVTQRIDSALADTACLRFLTAVSIYDITADKTVYRLNEQVRMRPASTEKLVTAIAVLDMLGPDYTLDTRVLTRGTLRGGVLSGDLWIVGAMDPVMDKDDLRSLCRAISSAGVRRVDGHVYVDLGLKDEDKFGWGWCWDDKNPTLTPLLLGGKPDFISLLPAQLRAAGISLSHAAIKQSAVPGDAQLLVQQCRPLIEVMEPMMKKSDNLYAECVFYQLATLTGKRMATHEDVAAVVNQVINRAGASSCHVQVADGSGLSLYNYQTAETYISLLRYIHAKPEAYEMLRLVLPIAAVDGTLKNRMAGTAAAENVRAKTGTVTGVSTLTGYTTCHTTGHLLAFAILTNGVEQGSIGRALQDKICIAISE